MATSDVYRVRTGLYNDQDRANRIRQDLGSSYGGLSPRVTQEDNGRYRVTADFNDQDRASNVFSRIQERGLTSRGGVDTIGVNRPESTSNNQESSSERRQALSQNEDFNNQYRSQTATIEDLQKKYGFDYSREYAERQAEAEAQARRDAIENQERQAESNLEGSAEALDRDYFQRGLQQNQQLTNSGLNAGIANDANLRLAMSRQAALGDQYRDTNNILADLAAQEGRVELERLAREDALFNDRLQQGFENTLEMDRNQLDIDNANFERRMETADRLGFLNGVETTDEAQRQTENWLDEGRLTGNLGLNNEQQGLVNQLLELKRQNETPGTDPAQRRINTQFADEIRNQLAMQGINPDDLSATTGADAVLGNMNNLRPTMDRQRTTEQGQQFYDELDWRRTESNRDFEENQRQFNESMEWSREELNTRLDWEREQFNNLSAAEKEQFSLNWDQLEQRKAEFDTEQEWREYTYENMSAAEREQFEETARQHDEEMAWREYEFNETMNFEAGYEGEGEDSYSSANFRE